MSDSMDVQSSIEEKKFRRDFDTVEKEFLVGLKNTVPYNPQAEDAKYAQNRQNTDDTVKPSDFKIKFLSDAEIEQQKIQKQKEFESGKEIRNEKQKQRREKSKSNKMTEVRKKDIELGEKAMSKANQSVEPVIQPMSQSSVSSPTDPVIALEEDSQVAGNYKEAERASSNATKEPEPAKKTIRRGNVSPDVTINEEGQVVMKWVKFIIIDKKRHAHLLNLPKQMNFGDDGCVSLTYNAATRVLVISPLKKDAP